jgi:di/tricarboxylate transporter
VTPQIIGVFAILLISVSLFITERLRVDLVAIMVLVSLALTGLVTPTEALSGFSNLAVITVWAILILSEGLTKTGVATWVASLINRFAGTGEVRLTAILMLTVGVLSGFMNSIGVAALMLPAVIGLARKTGRPPSKLLIPLSFGALMGGMSTLIGTPPNLLISEALQSRGIAPFEMFDFTPTGVIVLLVGVVFVSLLGSRLLPSSGFERGRNSLSGKELSETYGLKERLFIIHLPDGSSLAGKTVLESRIGTALGLNLIAILRSGDMLLAPASGTILEAGDQLLVGGRLDKLREVSQQGPLELENEELSLESLTSAELEFVQLGLPPHSPFIGKTLGDIQFRQQYELNVLAIWRDGKPRRTGLQNMQLAMGDILLVQGTAEKIHAMQDEPNLFVSSADEIEVYRLKERLIMVRIPAKSKLAGKTLSESRLGESFGFNVLSIVRDGKQISMPGGGQKLIVGDSLILEGRTSDLEALEGLRGLEISRGDDVDLSQLETDDVGLVEVVLSPRSSMAGRTLRDLQFREKFGLSVLAIWRGGRAYRSNLSYMPLQFGDALLLHGPNERFQVMATEPDFIILTEAIPRSIRPKKGPIAVLIMAAVLIPVIAGWIPIAVAAVGGVVLMILSGALTMDEAYQSIDWRVIFVIAGMLPLGIALDRTGAAQLIADGVVGLVGAWGPLAVMGGLFVLAALASQFMPNPAVAVLLAPIALNAASDLNVSPYPMMMTVAVSASAAFLSPVGHPANLLIMGPGGYKFADYLKIGIPLTLLVFVVVLIAMPLIWPF